MTTTLSTSLNGLAAKINSEHRQAEEHLNAGIRHALAAGRALLTAKESLPHGIFGDWVTVNLDCTVRTAQRYARVASEWPRIEQASNATTLSHLTVHSALLLIADTTATDERAKLTADEAKRLKSLTADVHASMQQMIDSASAAAELTGESVEDVLNEQLSENPAVLQMVLHKLKLPA